MANVKNPILESVRIIPRDPGFLDRKLGSRGEIFFDQTDNTLRLYDGSTSGGIPLLRADLENIDGVIGAALGENPPTGVQPGTIWFNTANGRLYILYSDGTSTQWVQPQTPSYGAGGSGGATTLNGLTDVTISGVTTGEILKWNGSQWVNAPDATASGSSNLDHLGDVTTTSPVAGQVLAYNGTQWVNTSVGSGNSFANISVFGQGSVVADQQSDTVTLVAGSNVTITTNPTNDSITISASAGTAFSSLTDSASAALTVDKIYMPAITMLTVTNYLTQAYRFDQYGTGNNPTVYAISGLTIAFNLQCTGHPFQIQDPYGENITEGLTHVTTDGTVTTGANAQGKTSGTLYWKIPFTISGGYRYQASSFAGMVGSLTIKALNAL